MTAIKLLTLITFFAVAYSLDTDKEPVKAAPLNLYFIKDAGMIYTKTPPTLKLLTGSKSVYKLSPLNDQPTKQEKSLVIQMIDKNSTEESRFRLSFNFAVTESVGTWNLNDIECQQVTPPSTKELLKPNISISTSLGYSFHTPSKVGFKSDSFELTFDSLQVEYFNGKIHPMRFSVADDTVYFFTIPILSGFFVISLLVTIVLLGLSMIYDIKTMDLFDDPKGKTVTINASE